MNNVKKYFAGKLRKIALLGFDCLCFAIISISYYFFNLIFDPHLDYTVNKFFTNAVLLLLTVLVVRLVFGIYNSVLRYTRTLNFFKLILADIIGGTAAAVVSWICRMYEGIWFFIIIAAVNALAALFARFSYRLIYKVRNNVSEDMSNHIGVAIVGAGQLGAYLANELLYNPDSKYKPMFFIDKDPGKLGNRIAGLKIYSEDDNILEIVKKYDVREIFIAIANIDSQTATQLFEFYSRTSCKLKIYDVPVKEFGHNASNGQSARAVRKFEIEDLLFRQQLTVNNSETVAYYSSKTILITGGGGSIGSELCRQVAKCNPKKLIILDIYENNAYDIQQELLRKYKDKLDLSVEIASVRDRKRLEAIFNYYHPQVVFHAAAHKHVPLMEHSGCEAIKNNVFGTLNTADMAEKYGAEKFILISTDKAVNPTNIMGATKRMCEMIVQCRKDSKTSFAAVRFGNVLGSNGSVIPLFKQQIEQGGPITITDKRIIRYFMTIPEASQLVMEAGAMAKRGEPFVLDMGKPIRIYDLAINMIKLSGFEPGVDIKIEEIGLRPGEKLYEELLIRSETLDKTDNNMIFIEKDAPLSREKVEDKLKDLEAAVIKAENEIDSASIKKALKKAVPTFVDPEEINENASGAREMAEANA